MTLDGAVFVNQVPKWKLSLICYNKNLLKKVRLGLSEKLEWAYTWMGPKWMTT